MFDDNIIESNRRKAEIRERILQEFPWIGSSGDYLRIYTVKPRFIRYGLDEYFETMEEEIQRVQEDFRREKILHRCSFSLYSEWVCYFWDDWYKKNAMYKVYISDRNLILYNIRTETYPKKIPLKNIVDFSVTWDQGMVILRQIKRTGKKETLCFVGEEELLKRLVEEFKKYANLEYTVQKKPEVKELKQLGYLEYPRKRSQNDGF